MPNGVSIARPPALIAPLACVWQTAQSPRAASCWPRAMVSADQVDASGRAIGAIDRHGNAIAARLTIVAIMAAALANTPTRLANGFWCVREAGCGSLGAGPGKVACVAGCPPRNP